MEFIYAAIRIIMYMMDLSCVNYGGMTKFFLLSDRVGIL